MDDWTDTEVMDRVYLEGTAFGPPDSDQRLVRRRRYRAPWCEVFTYFAKVTENRILNLSPEDEAYLKHLDWQRRHQYD